MLSKEYDNLEYRCSEKTMHVHNSALATCTLGTHDVTVW